MISERDTLKQDLGLVVAGLLAAALFFWLYSESHPLGAADSSYGETAASEASVEILQSLGFYSNTRPVTFFKINGSLADSLQKQTSFRDFYEDERARSVFPVFYWSSSFKMEELSPENMWDYSSDQAKTIEITLSENGELLALDNRYEILPSKNADLSVLAYAFGDSVEGISNLRTDSLIYQRLQFQFDEIERNTDVNTDINPEGRNFLGERIAEKIAEYYFRSTGWPQDQFSLAEVEEVSVGDTDGAKVTYRLNESSVRQVTELDFTVLPTGTLYSIELNYPVNGSQSLNLDQIKTGIRMIVILLGVFWILILLFIRFRLRLIDIKPAVLVAVLAGFIFPFLMILDIFHSHVYSFGEINIQFLFRQLLNIGIVAAFTSISYFVVCAIADSLTREHWAEKLRTVDLIRIGHFINKPLALTFIRGISYSFMLAAFMALLMLVLPESWFSLENDFSGNSSYLPNIHVLLSNLVVMFITVQAIFLIFLSKLRSSVTASAVLVFFVALAFILLNPLPVEIGSLTTELVTVGSIGLAVGWIYLREDFLTTFIASFFFANLLSSSGGWVMDQSPDASIFYSTLILIGAGFIYGFYGLYKGKSIRDLPKFVPDYINELAQEERIKQELQIARKVQQSFLPESTPDIAGLDIAAVCKPAYETGGDYYDFISLNEDQLAVVIGDVSGKGIQAAFFMTFTKGVLHALCDDFKSTIDVLTKTNKMFRRNANRGTFISLIFGVVDVKEEIFCFSRAGHNPLLYFNSSEGKLQEYTPQGIGLGMAADNLFRKNISEQRISFKKDDILILFTDGVVEATSKTNTFYGDKRLQNLIKNHHKLSAEELLERILADLDSFGDGSEQHDDMTMLIIKKK
ncbi:MAG: SpoIIE family protein phosphatase [Balneolaceae bacterium]